MTGFSYEMLDLGIKLLVVTLVQMITEFIEFTLEILIVISGIFKRTAERHPHGSV